MAKDDVVILVTKKDRARLKKLAQSEGRTMMFVFKLMLDKYEGKGK